VSTSIRAIRDAIQTTLAAGLSTIHAYDTATGSERLSAPVLIVFPAPGGGRATAGGRYTRKFVIEVHCPLTGTLARAQDVLDDLIDDGSTSNIEDVLEADKTLGGVVESIRVDEFEAYGYAEVNGQDTLMLRIPMEVMHA
jgi:hypothetical protein